jgi:copper resistance protein B
MAGMAGIEQGMQMDHSQMGQATGVGKQSPQASPQQAKPGAGNGMAGMAGMAGMDQGMQMDHSQPGHAANEQMQMPGSPPQQAKSDKGSAMCGMAGMGAMAGMGQSMQMGPMQGGSAPPDARDPGAYAEGTHFAHLPGDEMNDDARFGRIVFDNLEYAKGDGEQGQNLDSEAWYGNDYDKAWLKAEGERRDGHLRSLRTEALWDHTIATFWSTQLGVRHDSGGGASRNWLAFGVRGLAPYWFDTEATAYWSGAGLAARFKVRYELLFTQRLILEPEVETNLYSRSDRARGQGSGLSDLGLNLRLRYEIRRQFAPYVGVTWNRNFGNTADFARATGERNKTTQIVAGVRIWY